MCKRCQSFKSIIFYTYILYNLRVVHSVHRVAEKVKGKFSAVDQVVCSAEKTFQSTKSCWLTIFKNEASILNFPSELNYYTSE